MNVQELSKSDSPQTKSTKRAIGALIITNCLIYGPILITLSLYSYRLDFAAYSVALILAYNIIEASCFFGCDAYNWPCTLTFRIIWILHDLAYFITFAVYASIYSSWDTARYKYCIETCNNDYYYDNCRDCNYYRMFPFLVSCCIFFLITFGINIATIVLFSKLPKTVCCGQMNSQVQPIIINLDGQTYRMQNLHNQGHTAQGSYVMQPVLTSAPIATVQTVVPMTTLQAPASGPVTTVQTAMPVATI